MQAFDSLLAGPVAEYLKISKEIGGDVQKHAEMVHTGLKLERALLVTASQCQQPAGVSSLLVGFVMVSRAGQVEGFLLSYHNMLR